MPEPVRLSSDTLVGALIRRVQGEGGNAMVLAKGDRHGGAILIACAERGRISCLLERVLDLEGQYRWMPCGPQDTEKAKELTDYIDRRKSHDPDLWIVELDIAQAERFAAETIS